MNSKLVLPATLVAIMVLALSPPAHGQGVMLVVDPQIIDVTVCSTFTVHVRIENLPFPGHSYDMWGFKIYVTFDPDAMSVENVELPEKTAWTLTSVIDNDNGVIKLTGDGNSPWSANGTWMIVTFHCMGAGTSSIGFRTDSFWYDWYFGQFFSFDFENSREGSVTQHARRAPRYSGWVGGELTSVNKLAVLAPYLALITIAAVATVYVAKRRSRT